MAAQRPAASISTTGELFGRDDHSNERLGGQLEELNLPLFREAPCIELARLNGAVRPFGNIGIDTRELCLHSVNYLPVLVASRSIIWVYTLLFAKSGEEARQHEHFNTSRRLEVDLYSAPTTLIHDFKWRRLQLSVRSNRIEFSR